MAVVGGGVVVDAADGVRLSHVLRVQGGEQFDQLYTALYGGFAFGERFHCKETSARNTAVHAAPDLRNMRFRQKAATL